MKSKVPRAFTARAMCGQSPSWLRSVPRNLGPWLVSMLPSLPVFRHSPCSSCKTPVIEFRALTQSDFMIFWILNVWLCGSDLVAVMECLIKQLKEGELWVHGFWGIYPWLLSSMHLSRTECSAECWRSPVPHSEQQCLPYLASHFYSTRAPSL